ncbi:MAG TPA: FAD-dependent monooxygenase [Methylovirgula sp.]|nr:FAD-dependent monooxygenase [Methylovirgula sp.]
MSTPPHALIAGGGIGGLAASLCLARAGWRVTLLERRRLTEDIGAGLQISPNASAILRELGVLPRLSASALAPKAIHVRRGRDGVTLAQLPIEHAERRWGAPYLLAHRGDLHRALIEAVAGEPAIKIHAECALVGFTADDNGVTAAVAHGAERVSYGADCLIGADGVRSFVRERLAEMQGRAADLPDRARHVAWRALVKSNKVALELRQPESTIWLGPGAHLVHYPLRGGRLTNVVALIDDPVRIDWTADIWAQSGDPHAIAARFAGWDQRIRGLIGAAEDWRLWPLVERDVAWGSGRVALIGDAAHPILPFLGQGAAQAIEDAAMLAKELKACAEIAPALVSFAAARAPRVARVQRESQEQARIYHASGAFAALRDLAILTLGRRIIARYDWLYDLSAAPA